MSDRITELGLFLPDATAGDRAAVLQALVDRTLGLLASGAAKLQDQAILECGEELEQDRQRLAAARETAGLTEAANTALQRTGKLVDRLRERLEERDAEMRALLETLREALATLAGGTQRFLTAMTASTTGIQSLMQVDDLRQLRLALSKEVAHLQHAVAEKRKEDEAHQASLAQRIAALESTVEETLAEALRDPLTGVANRRGFDRTIRLWMGGQRRDGHRFVLVMFDIDDFKSVNDAHGHQVGDRVLIGAARKLRAGSRATDFVARYGGEEFVLLLRGIDGERAEARVRQILAEVAATRYEYQEFGQTKYVRFTLSAGLAECSAGDRIDDLLRRADEALYEAKRSGKNQLRVARRSLLKSLIPTRPRAVARA